MHSCASFDDKLTFIRLMSTLDRSTLAVTDDVVLVWMGPNSGAPAVWPTMWFLRQWSKWSVYTLYVVSLAHLTALHYTLFLSTVVAHCAKTPCRNSRAVTWALFSRGVFDTRGAFFFSGPTDLELCYLHFIVGY